jgi:transcriptional regulator with XRE-family HTH domain
LLPGLALGRLAEPGSNQPAAQVRKRAILPRGPLPQICSIVRVDVQDDPLPLSAHDQGSLWAQMASPGITISNLIWESTTLIGKFTTRSRSAYPSPKRGGTLRGMGWRQKLLLARKRAGLTQDELGKRVGVSGQAINTYENENTNPPVGRFVALAVACGVAPAWLIDDVLPDDVPAGDVALVGELIRRLGPTEVVRRVLAAEPRARQHFPAEFADPAALNGGAEAPHDPPARNHRKRSG